LKRKQPSTIVVGKRKAHLRCACRTLAASTFLGSERLFFDSFELPEWDDLPFWAIIMISKNFLSVGA
jgi:hypothetical protein